MAFGSRSALPAGLLLAGAVLAGGEFPRYDDPHLSHGREVWVANCMTCHGYGIAGAPNPTDQSAWAHRLEKPRETLYQHALNGFFGPDDTMMPARGGNPDLSDDEVKAAVDYMATVAANTTLENTR